MGLVVTGIRNPCEAFGCEWEFAGPYALLCAWCHRVLVVIMG